MISGLCLYFLLCQTERSALADVQVKGRMNDVRRQTRATNQRQCHPHDHRGKDVVEGGDLKHVAVRVWIPMNIFILSGCPQGLGTIIFTVSLLKERKTTAVGAIKQTVDLIAETPFTCFTNLKLNSHKDSGRVPDTFRTQNSKHCKRSRKRKFDIEIWSRSVDGCGMRQTNQP